MKKLDSDLNCLRQAVVDMGQLAQKMVVNAVRAIEAENRESLIAEVEKWELQLDQMELDLDKKVIRLFAIHGPVAHDLRFVIAASRINSELERIGDNSGNVCESIKLLTTSQVHPHKHVLEIGELVRQMVSETLAAVRESDPDRARQTILLDDRIDAMNEQIVTEQLRNKGPLSESIAQVLIARSLERIADQCTNICEEIVFLEQGADIRHQPLNLTISTSAGTTSNSTV